MEILSFIKQAGLQSLEILLDSSLYILFGIGVAGILKMYLSPNYVASHLGRGRFGPVVKAALLGIPLPLCSCGVLPAAASLKKQGASNGATMAFLISTPESGVDSISITYALLDPIMAIARPVAAFLTAFVAGVGESLRTPPSPPSLQAADRNCPVDNCCDGSECSPEEHNNHHSLAEKLKGGIGYALNDLWPDLAGWFFVGIILAGLITAVVPDELVSIYLGGGVAAMLLMLLFGIPLYICASASTPIAAAFILKGVSPGAALVFLLVGPATNVASLSVLWSILGKKAMVLYLAAIAGVSVFCGLALDQVYALSGINARAVVGQAAEVFPFWAQVAGALVLVALSVRPLTKSIRNILCRIRRLGNKHDNSQCGCDGSCPTTSAVAPGSDQ